MARETRPAVLSGCVRRIMRQKDVKQTAIMRRLMDTLQRKRHILYTHMRTHTHTRGYGDEEQKPDTSKAMNRDRGGRGDEGMRGAAERRGEEANTGRKGRNRKLKKLMKQWLLTGNKGCAQTRRSKSHGEV